MVATNRGNKASLEMCGMGNLSQSNKSEEREKKTHRLQSLNRNHRESFSGRDLFKTIYSSEPMVTVLNIARGGPEGGTVHHALCERRE